MEQGQSDAHLHGFLIKLDVEGLKAQRKNYFIKLFKRNVRVQLNSFLLLESLDVLLFLKPLLH